MKMKRMIGTLTAKFAALMLAFTCVGSAWGAADTSWYDAGQSSFTLTTEAQLRGLAQLVNAGNSFSGKTITLGADVDVGSEEWVTIATSGDSTKFAGTFDGGNHTISNLFIDQSDETPAYRAAGFFGAINGTLKNLKFVNARVTGVSSGSATVNGIAVAVGSMAYGGTIDNVSVENATVRGNRYVAGIVGYAKGTVQNCTIKNVTIVAEPDKLTGTYDNGDKAGGIVGYCNGAVTIKNNTIEGDFSIRGYRDIGGIVGCGGSGTTLESNSVADDATVSVTVDQVTGNYGSKTPNAGVLAGRVNGATGTGGATIEDTNEVSASATTSTSTAVAVAKVGSVQYGSLDAATRAYQSGDTIEIIGDASGMTAPEGWMINAGTPATLVPCVAKIGETGYTTLAAALADVGENAPLTWVADSAWNSATPVYYNGNFYATLTAAINAANEANAATAALIYVKPNHQGGGKPFVADHDNIKTSITIYGNNASIGCSWEPTIEYDGASYHTLTKNVTFALYNLHDGAGAWGYRTSTYTSTVIMCNCTNAHEVLLNGPVNANSGNNIWNIKNCTFTKSDGSTTYGSAPTVGSMYPVTLNMEGCSFTDFNNNYTVNMNNKCGGTTSATITDCTFDNCGTSSKGAVRLNGVDANATVTGALTNLTFQNSNNLCDIQIGAASASDNNVNVSYTVSGTTGVLKVYETGSDTLKNEGATAIVAANTYTGDNTPLPPVAQVVKNNGATTNKYTNLATALNAGKASGSVVTLLADVDLNNEPWTPIGSQSEPFSGVFDGAGHTISNLYINLPGQDNVGLFASGGGATFKNFTIVNANVTGKECVAAVFGRTGGSAFLATNITVTGNVKVEAVTTSKYGRVGGIAGGWVYGHFVDCSVIGDGVATSYIKGPSDSRYAGGIVGHADDVQEYTRCVVKDIRIMADWLCGGVAGPGPASSTTTGCVVENVEINADYSGGLFGWLFTPSTQSDETKGVIDDCTVSNVSFTLSDSKNGAIGGYSIDPDVVVKNITVADVHNKTDDSKLLTYNATIVRNKEGGVDVYYYATPQEAVDNLKNENEVITVPNYTAGMTAPVGWDFSTDSESGVTTLVRLPPLVTVTIGGTTTGYYDLATALEAGKAAGSVVTLLADFDLAGVAWTPVGTSASPFCGNIDGNGKVISNLTVNDPTLDCAGLIGYGNGDQSHNYVIKDLTISNATITARSYLGALAGHIYAGYTVSNVTVKGLVQVSGNYMVGGVIGKSYVKVYDSAITGDEGSFVKGQYVEADLEGDNVGGFIGHLSEGTTLGLFNCSASGLTVLGSRKVGGLVGTTAPENHVENVSVSGVTVGTTATAEYANSNMSSMEVGGIVGSYYNSGTGGVISGTVEDVTIAELPSGVTGTGDGKNISYGLVTGGNRGADPANKLDYSALVAKGYDAAKYNNSYLINNYVAVVTDANGDFAGGYESLEDAVVAAASGSTVTLLEDYTMTNALNVIGKSLDIDLGGNTLKITENVNRLASGGVTTTIENGVIDISGVGNNSGTAGIFSAGHPLTGAANGGNTINISNVTLTGTDYYGHSVFQLYANCALNIEDSTVGLTNCLYTSGGFVKSDGSTYVVPITIKNSTIDLVNPQRGVIDGQTVIIDSTVRMVDDRAIAGDTVAKLDNGFNYNATTGAGACIAITNSSVTISGGTGRGITLNGKDVIVADGSTLAISGMAEGDIMFKKGSADNVVTAADDSHVTADTVVLNSSVTSLANELFSADATSTVPTFVAQIGNTPYTTLASAILAAQDGNTIEILDGTWGADAVGTLTTSEALSVRAKSLTIQAASGASPKFTSNVTLGYDDSSTRNATMTVKGLAFENAQLLIGNYAQTTVEDCLFSNATLRVIESCSSNYNRTDFVVDQVTIKDCTFDGTPSGEPAIRVRNSGNLLITGNTVANSAHNGILLESNGTVNTQVAKTVVVQGNTITEWNAGNVSGGGRGIRADLGTLAAGSTVTVEGNVFRKETLGLDEPDFAKITNVGSGTVNLSGNDWNDMLLSEVNGNGTIYTSSVEPTITSVVTTRQEPVAQIGETKYGSLAAAVAAANAGDTITMLADDNVSLTDGSRLTIDKSLTVTGPVDTNGEPLYTIYGKPTVTGTNNIYIDGDGTVTLSNLKIEGFGNDKGTDSSHAPVYVASSFTGTVNLDNLYISDFNRGGVFLYGGTFNVTDCYIDCANSRSGAFTKGVEIKGTATGTITDTVIVNMERSSTTYSTAGIEVYGNGSIVVDGCTIISDVDPHQSVKGTYGIVSQRVGDHDPSGGSLHVTDCYIDVSNAALSVADNDEYGPVNNYSIVVDGEDTYFSNYIATWSSTSSITINEGEFTEDVYADSGTITITGGTFNNFLPDTGTGGTISISGGSFDAEVPEAYCASGYIPSAQDPTTGMYTVKQGAYVAAVISANGATTNKYETLQTALDNANSGDTVKLLADADLTQYAAVSYHQLDVSGLTLDLNGNMITVNNGGVAWVGEDAVISNGTFTTVGSYAMHVGDDGVTTSNILLKDLTLVGGVNVYNADGIVLEDVTATGHTYYAVWADEGAEVTVKSGTYSTEGSYGLLGTARDDGNGIGNIAVEGGTFTTNGGKFSPDSNGYTPAGAIQISGGQFNTSVPEKYCAFGKMPSPLDPVTGMYTVIPGIVYPTGGDSVGVQIPLSWVKANTELVAGDSPTAAEMENIVSQNGLGANGVNGVPVWESYVLGLNPNVTTSQVKLEGSAAVNDGGVFKVAIKGLNVNVPEVLASQGTTVNFRIEESVPGSDSWTARSDTCTIGADGKPTFLVPINELSGKILRIVADIVTKAE